VSEEGNSEALRAAVGAEPPAGLVERLTAEQLGTLAAKVTEVRTAQSRALARATEDALGHVPRILRGAVQRILP
jgi:hypothetical protein